MTTTTCPACNHTFDLAATDPGTTPDPSVWRWFSTDNSSTDPVSTTEVYLAYLQSVEGTPVPRRRFTSDLAYLGVEEENDGDQAILLRD